MTTQISKAQVAAIHAEVTAAVKAVLEARGYKLGKDSCRYSDFDLKFSIEAVKNDSNAIAERARQMHSFDFKSYGIDYGTVVTDRANKRTFMVEGFNRTGKLQARDQKDGKVYTGDTKWFFLENESLEARYVRRTNDGSAFKDTPVTVTTRPVAPVIPFSVKTADAAKKGSV